MRTPPGIGFNPGRMDTWRMLVHLPSFIKLYTRLWIDALSDFLIPLGWVDDAAVLTAALWTFVKLCPRRVVQEHVEIIDEGG